jgi:glycosyltransferase involved in cell wall biosynthesis
MKVAMVTTVGPRCGIAAYTQALVSALRKLDETEVEIVPISVGKQPIGHYIAQAERLNAPEMDLVHVQHEYSFWGAMGPSRAERTVALKLALHLSQSSPTSGYLDFRALIEKPVILTAHSTSTFRAAALAGPRPGTRHRVATRVLGWNRRFITSIERLPFARTDATIVHTHAARAEFARRGLDEEKIAVVPMGVPEPSSGTGPSLAERYGLANRRVIAIFGYITPWKGYELTLDVLPHLPDDVVLLIAGSPRTADDEPYVVTLERSIRDRGLEDRVVVTGYLDEPNLAAAMEGCTLVLAPHMAASTSYSVMIPLTYGKPVLASDLDCFREMNAEHASVELFRTNDIHDYRAKLLRLIEDDVLRADLAAAGAAHAAESSWPCVAKRVRDIYDAVLDGKPVGPA